MEYGHAPVRQPPVRWRPVAVFFCFGIDAPQDCHVVAAGYLFERTSIRLKELRQRLMPPSLRPTSAAAEGRGCARPKVRGEIIELLDPASPAHR